jgi:hypothetical protein
MVSLAVVFHDCARRYLLGPLTIPSTRLGLTFYMFVLALFLGANAFEMFFSRHVAHLLASNLPNSI